MTKPPPGQCPSTGCKSPGDPFCPAHLEIMPYAGKLMAELAANEEEVALAREGKWRAIDVNGRLAQEFLRFVRQGDRPTLARVSRACFSDGSKDDCVAYTATGTSYMEALSKAGLLQIDRNDRGAVIVFPSRRRRRRRRRS